MVEHSITRPAPTPTLRSLAPVLDFGLLNDIEALEQVGWLFTAAGHIMSHKVSSGEATSARECLEAALFDLEPDGGERAAMEVALQDACGVFAAMSGRPV